MFKMMSNECSPRTPSNGGQYETPRSRSRSPLGGSSQIEIRVPRTRISLRRSEHDMISMSKQKTPCQMDDFIDVMEQVKLNGIRTNSDTKQNLMANASRITLRRQSAAMLCSQNNCRKSSSSVIRTVSGQELQMTPSMELEIEQGEEEDVTVFSELLMETEEKKFGNMRNFQDDANEYDSEATTDGEAASVPLCNNADEAESRSLVNDQPRRHDSQVQMETDSSCRGQKEDLLHDVTYIQSLYHPALLRRNYQDCNQQPRPKSSSIQDDVRSDPTRSESDAASPRAVNITYRRTSPQRWHQASENLPNIR